VRGLSLPIWGNSPIIVTDFSVSCPGGSDSLNSSNSSCSWISVGSKPHILWSTSSACSDSSIGNSVSSVSKNLINKVGVLRNLIDHGIKHTTPAVRWFSNLSIRSIMRSKSESFHDVTIWKGPKSSVVTSL